VGSVLQFIAGAQNNGGTSVTPTFTFAISPSSPAGILDVAPNGAACAGSWNGPLFTICTPAGAGVVQVTASALGATSPPTFVFVHPAIANIQISVVPPVNSPPPACPTQTALPAACDIPFNVNNCTIKVNSQGVSYPSCACLSQNQAETLQATAYDSQGTDITASVGPFVFSEVNSTVVHTTPIVNPSYNVATNQVTVAPDTPGQTQLIASAGGVFSQPYNFETCPIQCITLDVSPNGQFTNQTSFVTNKGTSETITATAVDIQGCMVPKPPLTWTSTQPAAISPGNAAGCAAGTTCALSTPQAGAAAITATCTPPTCNIGFPLNPAGLLPPYVPQPVYPVTAISGLVTAAATTSSGATVATSVLATSQDCYSNPLCGVGLYDIATNKNVAVSPTTLPSAPNSLMFDPAGDKAYMGSEFGAVVINPANIGSSTTSPFTPLPAPATPLGLVTGKVIAVSSNGSLAIFSDTVSTPNQIYVVDTAGSSVTTQLNINGAIAAAFSPDGLKAFILGNGGNTLYIYSPLQALQPPISLLAPANAIVFSSSGAFALLSGGSAPGTLATFNTCDNSLVNLPLPTPPATGLPGPPTFLKMVPAGNVSLGAAIVPIPLEPIGLDFFFGVDSTGIDIIATNSSQPPFTALCHQTVTYAHTPPPPIGPATPIFFDPIHIDLQQGTFHPINFFLSPDATKFYIVTSDLGVLVFSFSSGAASAIPLSGNAAPLAADMTVDGTLVYVAATDGMLHILDTTTASEPELPIVFPPLTNSANSFCFSSINCSLDLVTVKP
jgi:WD40 repeat protein